jgi:membrane protein involved in colicin uptake
MGEVSATTADPQALHAEIASLRSQLEEARDEAELNLLQLQQVKEELEFYLLAHQEQQQLLEQHQQEERRAEVLIAALLERLEGARG